MGKHFEVAVYQTSNLTSYCYSEYGDSWRAQKRAETYISGAFNQSQHTVTVSTPSFEVNAPQEKVRKQFDAEEPCGTWQLTYDNLSQWWDDRKENCSDLSHSSDVDLLLTGYDGEEGLCVGDQSAASEGGIHIADLPSSYYEYGCTRPYDSMQTALHEMAHGIMNGGADGFEEHEVGNTIDISGKKCRTPFATPGKDNECGEYVEDYECDAMQYSECCESKMRHT